MPGLFVALRRPPHFPHGPKHPIGTTSTPSSRRCRTAPVPVSTIEKAGLPADCPAAVLASNAFKRSARKSVPTLPSSFRTVRRDEGPPRRTSSRSRRGSVGPCRPMPRREAPHQASTNTTPLSTVRICGLRTWSNRLRGPSKSRVKMSSKRAAPTVPYTIRIGNALSHT